MAQVSSGAEPTSASTDEIPVREIPLRIPFRSLGYIWVLPRHAYFGTFLVKACVLRIHPNFYSYAGLSALLIVFQHLSVQVSWNTIIVILPVRPCLFLFISVALLRAPYLGFTPIFIPTRNCSTLPIVFRHFSVQVSWNTVIVVLPVRPRLFPSVSVSPLVSISVAPSRAPYASVSPLPLIVSFLSFARLLAERRTPGVRT